MNTLKEVVLDYVTRKNTDYALLINGEWGCGKTFYWREEISPLLTDNEYHPIYVSLNGINDVAQIGSKIFLEKVKLKKTSDNILNNLFNRKSEIIMDKGTEIGKVLINIASNKFGIDKVIKNIKFDNLLNLENVIICFDDLERCKLDTDIVFGYINSFVEHDNISTVFIGNESEIDEKIYKDIKEKIIGKTIDFQPDLSYYKSVLNNIISTFDNNKYVIFLRENKEQIMKVFDEDGFNIRSLKHALNDFKIIFDSIYKYDKQEIDTLLNKLLLFTLSITFEYKNGISISKLNKISYEKYVSVVMFDHKEGEQDDYIIKFLNKYFNGKMDEFYRSDVVFNFIITGYFHKDKFEKEVKSYLEEMKVSSYQLLQQYWKLSDNEFKDVLNEVVQKAIDGKYPIGSYPRLFSRLIYFNNTNLANFDLNSVKEDFINGLKKAFNHSEYDQFIDDHFIEDNNMPDEYQEVKDFTIEMNKKLKEKKYENKINRIISVMESNFDKFLKELYDLSKNISLLIFKYIDIDAFFEKLISLDNRRINEIRNFIKDRYNYSANDLKKLYSEEYENLTILHNKLTDYLKGKENKLSIHLLNELNNILAEITNKLEEG